MYFAGWNEGSLSSYCYAYIIHFITRNARTCLIPVYVFTFTAVSICNNI